MGVLHEDDDIDSNDDSSVLGTGARILVAEDDPAMRKLVTSRLLDEGYQVYEAASADSFLKIVSFMTHDAVPAGGIDLVVSDIRMPGPSGLDVLRQLRAGGWSTPVVLMTAFPDPDVVAEAKRLGTPLLRKPFVLRTLVDVVWWALLVRAFPKRPQHSAQKS
jgi:CheY-like chemotaxis protein